MSEKTLTQEITELLDLEREQTPNKHGRGPTRDEELIYFERRRDVFRRVREQAVLGGDREEQTRAAAAVRAAQEWLDRLDAAERAELYASTH